MVLAGALILLGVCIGAGAVDAGASFLCLAALELRCGVHQQQNAGEVFIEVVQADLFEVLGRVADDDIVLALVLLGSVSLFFFFLQHMLAAGIIVFDRGLLEDDHKVGQTLIGDDLRNAGKCEITQKILAVHSDGGRVEAKLIGGFLQAHEVRALHVGSHHIA